MKGKPYEIAICEIQTEIDREYAEYQRLYRKNYMEEDEDAKIIYQHKNDLLKTILKRIEHYERI